MSLISISIALLWTLQVGAIELSPLGDDSEHWLQRGAIAVENGDYDRAIDNFTQVIDRDAFVTS
ncbi:MAG: tetratricopeptide repeat protein [Cyanobacteriota bacterium]|nr:tetratricopeptide repeat protein [Cyanobacteriota bacterium]